MNISRVSIVRLSPSDRAARVAEAMKSPGVFGAARVLKAEGNAWVRLIEVSGEKIIVKCRPLHTIRRRVQSLLGMGHAHRQWRGAERLKRANILTAEPILIARARVNSVPCELLVLEYIPGPTLLELLSDIAHSRGPNVKQQHAIARAVGGSVLALHRAGLHNKDHKPSNLIVVDAESTSPQITIIDCVGVSLPKRRDRFAILADLMIEPLGCDCPPRRSLILRALRHIQNFPLTNPRQRHDFIKDIWLLTHHIIQSRPARRPAIDPLSSRA